MSSPKVALTPLTWKQARETFHQLNPELATLIDELDPPKELLLYQARYNYGDRFLDKGDFFLPTDTGDLVPLLIVS